ncbi:MAG: hypothetical protein ACOY4F_15755 [Thermodesulfobacteriota bacterium]
MSQVSTTPQRRREALREFLGVTRPDLGGEAAIALAESIPPLVPELHEKWADMFAARLLETVPADQVALLCDGSPENAASLTLAYLMFLESERMEKQVAADIEAYRREHPELAGKGRELTDTMLARHEAARRDKAASYVAGKTPRQ